MDEASPAARNVLVVGGSGLIGGHAALRLKEAGYGVTIASRTRPAKGPLSELSFIKLNYIDDAVTPEFFAPFDTLVFAAGNDYRHVPDDAESAAHWEHANSVAVPAFFEKARDGGIEVAVLIGSFYPQAAPSLLDDPYVASRLRADEGVRALNGDAFRVVVLNAPYVIGIVPGLEVTQNDVFSRWAAGGWDRIPRFMVKGGVNVISTDTLSDAIIGAIERGEGGKAYLVGDENLTFQEYFGLYFKAAGDDRPLEVRDEPHQFISNGIVCRAPNSTIYVHTPPEDIERLGYRRNDVARTVNLIVSNYLKSRETSG